MLYGKQDKQKQILVSGIKKKTQTEVRKQTIVTI